VCFLLAIYRWILIFKRILPIKTEGLSISFEFTKSMCSRNKNRFMFIDPMCKRNSYHKFRRNCKHYFFLNTSCSQYTPSKIFISEINVDAFKLTEFFDSSCVVDNNFTEIILTREKHRGYFFIC